MYTGWFEIGLGNEIGNNARFYQYAMHAAPTFYVKNPDSPGLLDALNDGEDYSPDMTDAPWYDPDSVGYGSTSGHFIGMKVLGISGLIDSTWEAGVTQGIGDGGVTSDGRYAVREIRVRAFLLALDDAGIEYGIAWLRGAMEPGGCGMHPDGTRGSTCGTATFTFFSTCPKPRTDETDAEWAAYIQSLRRHVHGVKLVSGPLSLREHRRKHAVGMEIEFTFVAENPHVYTELVQPELDRSDGSYVLDSPYNLAPYPSAELTSGTVEVSRNYVSNPSFEVDTSGWSPGSESLNLIRDPSFEDPAAYPWGSGNPAPPFVVDGAGPAHTGTHALRMDAAPDPRSTPGNQIQVTPGELVYLKLWAYRDAAYDGGDAAEFTVLDLATAAPIAQLEYGAGALSASGEWVELTAQFYVPANTSQIYFTLGADHTAGQLWIDDIEVRRTIPAYGSFGREASTIAPAGGYVAELQMLGDGVTEDSGTARLFAIHQVDAVALTPGDAVTMNIWLSGQKVSGATSSIEEIYVELIWTDGYGNPVRTDRWNVPPEGFASTTLSEVTTVPEGVEYAIIRPTAVVNWVSSADPALNTDLRLFFDAVGLIS